eukprot:TRINITY_DN7513_c1_g2_i1.p1 TRINITY_DN7513_c1_g2~~TRINITY_DN7513_c1_g2_i1.p1  ORF type:complete len:246 (+),score=54.47 TRINITY_DN7513_c1_g2_i1:44-781(+)
MSEKIVLASDLDGTWIRGSGEAKKKLYSAVEANRDRITLVYATGRTLESVSKLDIPLLPVPDYYICEVGTAIYNSDKTPLKSIQSWISEKWPEGTQAKVQQLLEGIPGLTSQDEVQTSRMSFDYKKDVFPAGKAAEIVTAAGFDVIDSHDRYFDVLPLGVSKGPVLLQLLKHLNTDPSKLIIAGDSGNDTSMFMLGEFGSHGILVGNAHSDLKEAIKDCKNVVAAKGEGTVGVYEGLVRLGVLSE